MKDLGKINVLPGSSDPMKASANTSHQNLRNQAYIALGGGVSTITTECPSVVGATHQQQSSSCALFKTAMEANMLIGGKRINKPRNQSIQKKLSKRKRIKHSVNKRVKWSVNKRVKRSINKRVKRKRKTRGLRVTRQRYLSR